MIKSIRGSALQVNEMVTSISAPEIFWHPSVLSWALTCVTTVLSYVFKNLYCKYRDILKEIDFLRVELLKTSNKIEILSSKMDGNFDNLKTIINYLESGRCK